jgi:hypothetical protein
MAGQSGDDHGVRGPISCLSRYSWVERRGGSVSRRFKAFPVTFTTTGALEQGRKIPNVFNADGLDQSEDWSFYQQSQAVFVWCNQKRRSFDLPQPAQRPAVRHAMNKKRARATGLRLAGHGPFSRIEEPRCEYDIQPCKRVARIVKRLAPNPKTITGLIATCRPSDSGGQPPCPSHRRTAKPLPSST